MENKNKNSRRMFADVRTLAIAAMLVALNVVLTRYFSISTQFLRIGFGFLPVAVFSILYGPVPSGIAAALADVIGYFLNPTGPYFPGFTLSAFLLGLIFGLFLYKRELSLKRIVVCCFFTAFALDALGTVWLTILYHYGIMAIIWQRLMQAVVKFAIEVVILVAYSKLLDKTLRKQIR